MWPICKVVLCRLRLELRCRVVAAGIRLWLILARRKLMVNVATDDAGLFASFLLGAIVLRDEKYIKSLIS